MVKWLKKIKIRIKVNRVKRKLNKANSLKRKIER